MPIIFSDGSHPNRERNCALVMVVKARDEEPSASDHAHCGVDVYLYIRPFYRADQGAFLSAIETYEARLQQQGRVFDAVFIGRDGSSPRVFAALQAIVDAAVEEEVRVPIIMQGNRAIVTLYNVDTEILDNEPQQGGAVRAYTIPRQAVCPKTYAAFLCLMGVIGEREPHIADFLDEVHQLPLTREPAYGRRATSAAPSP